MDFLQEPFLEYIKDKPYWTVSTPDKKPLDIFELKYNKRVKGANIHVPGTTVTLSELMELIPGVEHKTYFLDTLRDKICILDIEPTASKELKQKALKFPCLYAEHSMSKKGIHLVFLLPDGWVEKYPILAQKVTIKDPNNTYEFLLNHWITFTGYKIKPSPEQLPIEELYTLLEDLILTQKVSHVNKEVKLEQEPDYSQIPFFSQIMKTLDRVAIGYLAKDVNKSDMSKYEFGYIGHIYRHLLKLLDVSHIKASNYDFNDNVQAWMLYTCAKKHIDHRPKHNTKRENLPWLLYLSTQIIAKHEKKGN